MNAASKFLGPQKVQSLSKAFDAANNLMEVTQNPAEVIQKAGITLEDIRKAKTYINNPFAGGLLSLIGGNKEEILRGLGVAETFLSNNTTSVTPISNGSLSEQAPVSELDRLMSNLSHIK